MPGTRNSKPGTDIRAALGFLLVAVLALVGPPAFHDLARSTPAKPRVVYRAGGGPLLWSPGSPAFPPAADAQVLDPGGRPAHPVGGWQGMLLGHPLDLNRASSEDLEALPGVGPKLADSILDARRELRGFQAPDELLAVRGIGPKTLERLRPWVRATLPPAFPPRTRP